MSKVVLSIALIIIQICILLFAPNNLTSAIGDEVYNRPLTLKESLYETRFKSLDDLRYYITHSIPNDYYRDRYPYSEIIIYEAKMRGIPVHLALALIKIESNYNPYAVNLVNKNGSIDFGLMQLNSYSFPFLSQQEIFDIRKNLQYGLNYLKELYHRFSSWEDALLAYNAGPSRVKSNTPPESAVSYMLKVLLYEQELNLNYLNGE